MPNTLKIDMFPCLNDNYGFLIHDPISQYTATIDTPDDQKIAQRCHENGWTLTHILNTHHHFDHVGGNLALAEQFDGIHIIGSQSDTARIPSITQGLAHGDRFDFGEHEIQVFETPGHTLGHIIYYIPSAQSAFVGDTLFVLGCGRLFEGTPEHMYESLKLICALPDETRLYCAHEYTLSNAKFALTVEPDNPELLSYVKEAQALRSQNRPTVPTTVAMEKKTNPFVRAKSAQKLGEIRAAKDRF